MGGLCKPVAKLLQIPAVIPLADSANCPGGIADLQELLAQMRAGQTYVNVHTLANPGGEIRGQVEAPGSE